MTIAFSIILLFLSCIYIVSALIEFKKRKNRSAEHLIVGFSYSLASVIFLLTSEITAVERAILIAGTGLIMLNFSLLSLLIGFKSDERKNTKN